MVKDKAANDGAPMPTYKDLSDLRTKLVKGKMYKTAKGPAVWDGKQMVQK
jgi:hypothetical protein